MLEVPVHVAHQMNKKLLLYAPVIIILILILLRNFSQTSLEKNNSYIEILNGISGEYYESEPQINGDGLLLMKVNQVKLSDFKNFVSHYSMNEIDHTYDIMWFDFHQVQKWWPSRKIFKKGEKFYLKDDGSEFFVCLIGDVCYISHKTW